ncbi:hypothetical protein ACFY2V_40320 [Streptomyces eurythermus]|uniref:hypothetical protein n=1 Tax=Streptomyces eurythermus TaxID=42237 RepID=UPI0036A42BB0
MIYQKPIRSRAVVVAVGAAALAAAMVTPAQAAIPSAGTTFRITTTFDGKTLCVSSAETDLSSPIYPLINCNASDSAQQWRRSNNGRGIKNVGTGLCIDDGYLVAHGCDLRATPGELIWKQDDQGRVFSQRKDPFNQPYRTFWSNRSHVDGPRVDFPKGSYNNIPADASVYVFQEI